MHSNERFHLVLLCCLAMTMAFGMSFIANASDSSSQIILWHRFGDDHRETFLSEMSSYSKLAKVEIRLESGIDFAKALLRPKHALPDAVIIPSDLLSLAERVGFSPIDPTVQRKHLNAELVNQLLRNGKLYGIPLVDGNHLLLYFNRKLISNAFESWERLSSESWREPVLVLDYLQPYYLLPFLASPLGRAPFELSHAALRSAFSLYKRLITSGAVDSDCNYRCVREKFLSGKVPFAYSGDWFFFSAEQQLGNDLGIATLPVMQKGEPTPSFRNPLVLVFPGNSLSSRKRVELRRLAEFLSGVEFQSRFCRKLRCIPTNFRAAAQLRNESNRPYRELLATVDGARMMPEGLSPLWWSALARAFELYRLHDLEPSRAFELINTITQSEQKF